MAEKMGLTRNGLQRKLAGQSDLYVSELIFIADYFSISPAYFFSNENIQERNIEKEIDQIFDVLRDIVKDRIVKT